MLPYSLGSSLASMPAAWFIAYRQRKGKSMSAQKGVISLGLAIAIVGFGMFSSIYLSILYLVGPSLMWTLVQVCLSF